MGWYRPSAARCSSRSLRRPPIASPAPLLGLPLPWARIGDAVEDPALAHDARRDPAPQPDRPGGRVRQDLRASGALGELGFGYVVGGTITREPRAGQPQAADRAVSRARVHGERDGPAEPRRRGAPPRTWRARARPAPRFVSLADEALEDALAALDAARAARRRDRAERELSQRLVGPRPRQRGASARAARARSGARTPKPVFVKLPPFRREVEREVVLALARIAQEAAAPG